MRPATNQLDRLSRRSILKTTGGVLAGASLFAGSGGAQEQVPSLQMTIRRDRTSPAPEVGGLLAEVAVPSDDFFPTDVFFAQDTFLAVRDAYRVIGPLVTLEEKGWAANPEDVEHISANRLRFEFSPDDIFFPDDVFEKGRVTMALGVFPGKSAAEIPSTEERYWDTDSVRFERINERG